MKAKRRPKAPQVSLSVTETMIKDARPRDSQHCMIADAVRAAYPTAKRIAVDLATIRFTDPDKGLRYTYLTPRSAQVELVKFDRGNPTTPFAFKVRAGHVTRAGHKEEGAAKDVKRQEAGRKGGAKSVERLRRQSIRSHGPDGRAAERVGGKAPPLQRDSDTKVPFSRRRAFGLRALEY